MEGLSLRFSPNITIRLVPRRILYKGRTRYQEVMVIETEEFGRMLLLDGVVQFSSSDWRDYHEALAHPCAFYSEARPRRVLILGGGDGLLARLLLEADQGGEEFEEITVCDIDEEVVELCKAYFSDLNNSSLSHPKVRVVIGDAFEYLKECDGGYDAIICDVTDYSDYSALSKVAFSEDFFALANSKLKDEGAFASLGMPDFPPTEELSLEGLVERILRSFPLAVEIPVYIPSYFDVTHFIFAPKRVDERLDRWLGKGVGLPTQRRLAIRYYGQAPTSPNRKVGS